MPCRDMPKAMSTSGTAAAPISSSGAATTSGTDQPVAATTAPRAVAATIGLRTGWSMTSRARTRPRVDRSSTPRITGENTSTCTRICGTTYCASPTT
ncbi:MAG: hypothetical protein LBU50_03760 [Cellulomonas sp.]|nr:hypothetical protein [Cellulomonas sp.]